MQILPVSVIIPTRNRAVVLARTLEAIALQPHQPFEIIVIDASGNNESELVCLAVTNDLNSKVVYQRAVSKGAAVQRNQGISMANQAFIAFMDDDVYLETDCFYLLWKALSADEGTGGVNALISNQQFHPLGRISRNFYRLFANKDTIRNIEGKTIGPVLNFLCSENNKLELIPVEWLNLGLTIYRRTALPDPVFDPHFTGYSFMEDVALSFIVSRNWKLFTVRDARIYHDSQGGDHKDNVEKLAEMELINRFYVMTRIQNKRSTKNIFYLILYQLFILVATGKLFNLPTWHGKLKGLKVILKSKNV